MQFEETIDGSAFDDFSASSMLGDRLGLCLIGLFKVPMIRDLAEETVDGSAFDDFRASTMFAIIGRQVGCSKSQSYEILQKKQLMDQLLMISVLLLC